MNEDVIADLKQFIATTVEQQGVSLRRDIVDEITTQFRAELRAEIKTVHQKIDDLSAHIAETFEVSNDEYSQRLDGHERRIRKLEYTTGQVK